MHCFILLFQRTLMTLSVLTFFIGVRIEVGRSKRRCWNVHHPSPCGEEREQGGNVCCCQTHLAQLCVHRRQPRHQCQPTYVVDKGPTPPQPPNPPSPPPTPPGHAPQDLSCMLRNNGACPCWGRGAVPAPTLGEVKHTIALAML